MPHSEEDARCMDEEADESEAAACSVRHVRLGRSQWPRALAAALWCAAVACPCGGLLLLTRLQGRLGRPRPPARRLVEVCNASLVLPPSMSVPQALDMPGPVQRWCEQGRLPGTVSQWEGQNVCWEWLKQVGCYDTLGASGISWRDAQFRASWRGLTPDPAEVLMQPVRNAHLCEHSDLGAPLIERSEVLAATAWLRETVGVYVLNLPRASQRLRDMSARLRELGISFVRVPGVDLSVIGALEAVKHQGLVPERFDYVRAEVNARDVKSMGGIRGSAGCAAGHLRAMLHATRSGQRQPLALVLEDDVLLEPDFAAKLRRLVEGEAPCDWAAISLHSLCPYGECVSPHLTRVWPDGNEPAARCRRGVNLGFYAMLFRLNSLEDLRQKLQAVVFDEARPHCLDVDVALASISDEIPYYAVPHLQQPGFLRLRHGAGSSRVEANLGPWKVAGHTLGQ